MSGTTESEMLQRFMDSLKQAAGSAHQLVHAQQNPQWLSVRDMLEKIHANTSNLVLGRALTRAQVLSALDKRIQHVH